MFFLLNRWRTTAASASTAAGRTMCEPVIGGAIRDPSARRPFRLYIGRFVFLGLLCWGPLFVGLPSWRRRFPSHSAFGYFGRNRRAYPRCKVGYRRGRHRRDVFGGCAEPSVLILGIFGGTLLGLPFRPARIFREWFARKNLDWTSGIRPIRRPRIGTLGF